MPTDIVVGCKGQLGYELLRQLEARGADVIGVDIEDCDVGCNVAVRRLFARNPGVQRVFNAAAFTAVDAAEDQIEAAYEINAMAAGRLAAGCREAGACLVHFSTDYVFGHGHTAPINESQPPQPLSIYGRSKLLGEQLATGNCPRTFVLRTCGLYSHRGHNFVRTMVRHGLRGTALKVVDDQYITPTWVQPLARVAIEVSQTQIYGTYHAVSHQSCSWFEFAGHIFDTLGIDANLQPISHVAWAARAPRPAYSVLDNAMLRLGGLDHFRAWNLELGAFLKAHGARVVEEAIEGS